MEIQKRLAKRFIANVPTTITEESNDLQTPSSTQPQLNKLDEAFLTKLTSLIENNLEQEKIDIAFMTDRMNMSYSAFYRKVKALTELTPNEFVRKIKLRNCAILLQTGEYNVSDAAFRTGFNNMPHFRDCFFKEFNVSPSEYIKRHRK